MRERGIEKIRVIDSHTGGEPTRVVIDGFPDLGVGTMAERLALFRDHFDSYRAAIVNEPRGSDVLVGALLQTPVESSCKAGVIFFNNVGYLGMCGHGMIGLISTLAYLERIAPGTHQIETPVGTIAATLYEDGSVSIENVPAYRFRKEVEVDVAGYGRVVGDIAWGGNWFFLVHDHSEQMAFSNIERLTDFSRRIREALENQGITGQNGQEIDHIELCSPSPNPLADSRNFVLCPGMAYDRSPCGTGTSSRLACLYADGQLNEGEIWRQESITGSIFEGSLRISGTEIIPTIRGRAWVNSEATLLLNPADPCCWGIKDVK